jgi:uncharacterized delta-60 repeat protein
MKLLKAILLVPALLALLAGSALAKPAAPKSGVDPSFGHGGKIALSVPKESVGKPFRLATAPSGKSYALAGSLLLAFGANGRPDPDFGNNGRLQVTAATGATTEVNGLAVDAQGRVLVSGSFNPTPGAPAKVIDPAGHISSMPAPPSTAFVVRYLPNGERDATFGGAGEIDVSLTVPAWTGPQPPAHAEVPLVHSNRLSVVNGEEPVLGGTYQYWIIGCYATPVAAAGFVAPVDPRGAALQNVPPNTWAPLPLNQASALTPMPNGNLAALSTEGLVCGHFRTSDSQVTTLNYGSQPAPVLDPSRPRLYPNALAVDSQGRFLGLDDHSEAEFNLPVQPWKLERLLPDGTFDTSFGSNGGVPLKKFGEESIAGVVVDAKGRPTVGGGDDKFRLVRLTSQGKIDHSFGKGGWVEVGFGAGTETEFKAVAIDPKGRVLAAGLVTDSALKSGVGIALTRVLPGS